MNTQEDIEAGKHITGVRRRRGGLTREDPEEEEGWNELTAHRENPAERLRTAYGIPTQRQTRRGEKQVHACRLGFSRFPRTVTSIPIPLSRETETPPMCLCLPRADLDLCVPCSRGMLNFIGTTQNKGWATRR